MARTCFEDPFKRSFQPEATTPLLPDVNTEVATQRTSNDASKNIVSIPSASRCESIQLHRTSFMTRRLVFHNNNKSLPSYSEHYVCSRCHLNVSSMDSISQPTIRTDGGSPINRTNSLSSNHGRRHRAPKVGFKPTHDLTKITVKTHFDHVS